MIKLEGLSLTQKVLADIIWSLETKDEVENFIRSLPEPFRKDAMSITEMMLLAFIDKVDGIDEASEVLDKFRK